ncbi:MAG: alpha/beta hydrolase [Parvularculaceae bacterium]
MTEFPGPKFINAGDVKIAAYEAGKARAGRPPIILVHGWPEIAYSWKNQLPALADAGWRAVAIDLKGFGASDAPRDKNLYHVRYMTDDFAALLDALEIEKAVFCGHDWGGALVWWMAQLRPERVAGVIGVSTPLRKRAPAPPTAILAEKFTPNHYIVRFQEEGAPEQLFESEIERFFRFMFRKPAPRERWPEITPAVFDLQTRFALGRTPRPESLVMSAEDIDVYVEAYRRSGFRGGINLYRNIDANWAYMEGRDETVRAPSLWVGAELDLFLPPEKALDMPEIVPDLEMRVLSACGHWVMWERPAELNEIIVDWLGRRIRR